MLASALRLQVEINARALRLNLIGITDEDALVQPGGGGNCINWVVGHIAAARDEILSLLGEDPVWRPELAQRYARGSAAVRSASDAAASLTAIQQVVELSENRILRTLDTISPAELEASVGERTRGEELAFLEFHEAYHVGQLGLLRRHLGKERAIP